jgi:protein O-mannosyl-transferase
MKQKVGNKPEKPIIKGKSAKQRKSHAVNYVWGIVVFAIAFVLYSNTIGHDYALDDSGAILENRFVQAGFHGIPDLLKVDFWHFSNVHLGYYRPLSLITFAIEYHFTPNNPHVSHFINVFIFSLSGFLLFVVLSKFFNQYNYWFALLVSLLFVAHPIHTEIVANIKGRDELLSYCNTLVMFWLALLYFDSSKKLWLILSLVFCYLAMLSKETALTGVLLLPLILFYYKDYSIGNSIIKSFPFVLAAVLFFIQKKTLLGTLSGIIPDDIVNYPYREGSIKLPTTFLLFGFCIRLLLLPHPLRYDYSYNHIPAVHITNFWALFGLALFAAGAYYAYREAMKKNTWGFALALFYITLIPSLTFTILRGGIFAERFLFFPSLGFCIALVYAIGLLFKSSLYENVESISSYIKSNTKLIGLLSLVFLLYSFKTIKRNKAWKDNFTLFSTDIKTGENSAQNQRHYGNQYINMAREATDSTKKIEYANTGVAAMKNSLRIHPKFGESYFQIGLVYHTVINNNDSAIYYYNKAIETAPGYSPSYYNLGVLYQNIGRNNVASFYYNEAIRYNPQNAEAKVARDNLMNATGLNVQVNPLTNSFDLNASTKDAKYYYNAGNYYAGQGDYKNAAEQFTKAIEMDANSENAYINLANCYGMLKDYDKCIAVASKLLERNPNNLSVLDNLAVTYKLMGNDEKSKEYLEKANKLRGL